MKKTKIVIFLATILLAVSCSGKKNTIEKTERIETREVQQQKYEIKELTFTILDTITHDQTLFTQGFIFHNGFLYEGTGLEGQSKLLKIDPKNGKILKTKNLKKEYFGEGITIFDNKIFQLTWHNQTCIVYDLKTFKELNEIKYYGECWGLTNNDSLFILSDGTAYLRFINPEDFSILYSKLITYKDKSLTQINELELVGNKIYANIWGSDIIVVIDFESGNVIEQIDISSLRDIVKEDSYSPEVANGIAYDPKEDVFYVTGKNWSKIFKIKIKQ